MKKKKKISYIIRSIILTLLIILTVVILEIRQYKEEEKRFSNFEKTEKIYNTYANFSNKIPGILVLCYHRILPSNSLTLFAERKSLNSQVHSFNVNSNDFNYQMKYFHDHNINVISIEEMMKLLKSNKPITKKYVVLTFDDFDHTILNNAVPTLNKYKFPFTVFIATGKTHEYISGSYTASWRDIKKLDKNPLCTIGVHTDNAHFQENGKPRLLNMTLDEFKTDFNNSIEALDKHLSKPVNNIYFASPYGAITKDEVKYLEDNPKVQAAFTLNNDIIDYYKQDKEYGRIVVTKKNFQNIKNWLKEPQ